MRPDNSISISNVKDFEELRRFSSISISKLNEILNGSALFSDNVKCQIISATIGGSGSDTEVSHSLNQTPIGYIVIKNSADTGVYDGTTAWSSSKIYLRSGSSCNVTLILLAG